MSQLKPITSRLHQENDDLTQKIKKLEEEVSQKQKLADYYKRKIWHNELLISQQPKPKLLAVIIERLSDTRYSVNGKIVYKDIDGEWVSNSSDLDDNEKQGFLNHIRRVEPL